MNGVTKWIRNAIHFYTESSNGIGDHVEESDVGELP